MAEYIDREAVDNKIREALKELETDDDRMWRINKPYFKGLVWARRILLDEPVADVVEVVRCKECRYCQKLDDMDNGHWVCILYLDVYDRPFLPDFNHFCSYGERKGDCNNCNNHSIERKDGESNA